MNFRSEKDEKIVSVLFYVPAAVIMWFMAAVSLWISGYTLVVIFQKIF